QRDDNGSSDTLRRRLDAGMKGLPMGEGGMVTHTMQALDVPPTDLPGRSEDAMRMMLSALQAVAQGDFGMELPGHWEGLEGRLADAFNTVVRRYRALACKPARNGQLIGRDGQTRQRISLPNHHGL